jgi:tetratricopeptide (TPR) repeat protein
MGGYERFSTLILAVCAASAQTADAPALNAAGVDLIRLGRHSEAEAKLRRAREACEASQCAQLPAILNNLGSVYYATSRYREASPLFERSIALAGGADLASALGNLAAVRRIEARYPEASELYERALKLRGADPSLLARMALLAQDMGELDRGERLARQALELFGGADTAESAAARANLAGVLELQGKLDEAQQELRIALAMQERLLTAGHIALASTLDKLGLAYKLQGNLTDAERHYHRALAIHRAHSPTPQMASALNNLGAVLLARRKTRESRDALREAIAVWERLLGPDHPNVAAGLTNLALTLQARREYDEAEAAIERARVIVEARYPAGHTKIGLNLNHRASLAAARKRYAEAEILLLQAIPMLPAGHVDLAQARINLAEVYCSQGRIAESAAMYRRGIEILVNRWGADDERLLQWLERFAVVLRAQEEYAEAAKVDLQSNRIRVVKALR